MKRGGGVMPWLPFVWAAVLGTIVAGCTLGGASSTALALGIPIGGWWSAAGQAHGHLQLFGWGGMMVLGVGFFFLPRLRGAMLAQEALLPWILGLLSGGLALRLIAQLALALDGSAPSAFGLAGSGLLELAGATLALAVLVATSRDGPPLRQRPGLVQVLPYLVVSFSAFWLAMAANAVLVASAAAEGAAALPGTGDGLVVHLGLVGFLVPISVAVSARTLPLFLWLRVPSTRSLNLAFALFLIGLALTLWGYIGGGVRLRAVGSILEGAAFVSFAAVLQVVPIRRRSGAVPTRDPHYLRPVEWLLVPAYLWLALAGLLSILEGAGGILSSPPIPPDVTRHALASGFVTLLILGMGVRMLPGFSGRRVASVGLVWATVWLGNAAALLRVIPPALAALGGAALWPFGPVSAYLAISGPLGLAAVVCFGLNLWRTFGLSPGRQPTPDASPGERTPAADRRSGARRTERRPG